METLFWYWHVSWRDLGGHVTVHQRAKMCSDWTQEGMEHFPRIINKKNLHIHCQNISFIFLKTITETPLATEQRFCCSKWQTSNIWKPATDPTSLHIPFHLTTGESKDALRPLSGSRCISTDQVRLVVLRKWAQVGINTVTPAGLSKDSGWSLAAAAAPSAGLAALEMLQHRPTDSTVITLKTSFASGSGDATADNSSDYLAVQVEEFFLGSSCWCQLHSEFCRTVCCPTERTHLILFAIAGLKLKLAYSYLNCLILISFTIIWI